MSYAEVESPTELSDELDTLEDRARDGALTPPELAGETFTLADLGTHEIPRWTALVSPQQAAMLVAGAIRAVAIVRDGAIVAAEMATLTLGCDHRIVYPSEAARWLTQVRRAMETGAM